MNSKQQRYMIAPKIAKTTEQKMNFNTIALNKGYLLTKNYPTVEEEDKYDVLLENINNRPVILNLQLELMRYGYMFSEEALRCLAVMTDDELEDYSNDLADYLADAYGDGTFVSLFGNFPHTVLQMSEFEMFVHQIFHYLSGGSYSPAMPSCDDAELALLHNNYDGRVLRDEYRLIKPISHADFAQYFRSVLSGQQSLTAYDKKAVEYLCGHYKELGASFGDVFPEDIPFKETLCLVIANTSEYMPKTITDVLRYAVYLSGGDITLPALPSLLDFGWNPRLMFQEQRYYERWQKYYEERVAAARKPFNFMKFSRGQRRDILEMMEYVINHSKWNNVAADMKKYLGRWTRLGEILHPGEYQKKFPKAAEMFTLLRNSGQYIETYGGRLRAARETNDFDSLLSIYKERPGELLRNIDNLLRKNPEKADEIFDAVRNALEKSSTKMIYELLDHFYTRNEEDSRRNRVVTIKGARKPFALPCLPELDDEVLCRLMICIDDVLMKRFAAKESMTDKLVYLDKDLEGIALPKNMRSMNFMPGQMARGSKIKIQNNTGIFRLYCRWVDKMGAYDLDLSTQMFNNDFKYLTSISWNTNYKQGDWAVFSGDVRHRVGNCAEYIDVDINGAIAAGVRYILANVNDFDGQGFAKKDAWAGIMERSEMGTSGEKTWAPETITTGFRLTSVCTNIVMAVIDLYDMCMYVCDEDYAGIPVASTGVNRYGDIIKRYVNAEHYLNALTLIQKNCNARGASVNVLSHEDFTAQQQKFEDQAKAYKELIALYEETIKANPEKDEALENNLSTLKETYQKLKNNVTMISYDDIAADYTKLLAWMF